MGARLSTLFKNIFWSLSKDGFRGLSKDRFWPGSLSKDRCWSLLKDCNRLLVRIDGLLEAEAALEQARNETDAAKAEIAELIRSNQESQEKAMAAQQAAEQAAAASQDQARREMEAMAQAAKAANDARLLAEAAAHTANEEAEQKAAEAEEERKRTAVVQEQAKRDAQATQEQAERLQEAADEEKRKATAAQKAANVSKKVAEEQVKTANAAKQEAERKLKEGIQPVATPSPEEVRAAKRKVQYREDLFHFAVAGVAGAGKSSLINAFCGLRNKNLRAAATGVTETTLAMARIPHPDAEYPLVWYDIPGAGTLKISDWQYFNAQGLYIFDCIIILFDNRFTMTDIAILTNCRRFRIPTYIVRSKADQHISNIMDDMANDSEDDDDDESEYKKKKLYQAAREQFIQQTRKSVKDNLEGANIPDQKVYIVSNKTMIGVVKSKQAVKVIDEIELLNDLIQETQTRRARRDAEVDIIMNERWWPMIEIFKLLYCFLRALTNVDVDPFSP
ncbi:interferon-inducible GTPase-domain-containing protein [Suillus discolor]|uniref:Interferon-inducible GTPase-domain-containing protein n=1 Tax=Suillus discolor TaxID=1912936 RepID=A0A9P7F4Y8_9AGAM|nr:interferon-inducible GTPase-domain-containing protein [Suillus discolor]KAG2105089.1 interferon-inducible GTPase-domain-containing protein [Suillus discolor]